MTYNPGPILQWITYMRDAILRLTRRLVPSTATLTYNPVFKIVGDSIGKIPDLFFPEFRSLPPNHLRVRVGVSNRLLNNQVFHLTVAIPFWFEWLSAGYCSSKSDIVEIGCGCARIAQYLKADWFQGTYIGIDIDTEMIHWCRSHFPGPKFNFLLSPHVSKTYKSEGSSSEPFSLPRDNTKDFVFSTSLFTHLLEEETASYFKESARILKPGCYMYATFFSKQHVATGGRWTFGHRIGGAYVENPRLPEAAVAYDEDFFLDLARSAGFSEVSIVPSSGQSKLIARK